MKLEVHWYPHVPCKSFCVPVASPDEGRKLMEALANYDLFLFDEGHRPDYSNSGVLCCWDEELKEWEDY